MKNLRHLLRRSGWLSSEKRRRRIDRSRSGVNRRLSNETLEKRQLLAGDFALAHNYWEANDVDDNLAITAKDALTVINHLNRDGSGQEITSRDQFSSFVDVNADHRVTASDALSVINALNRGETEMHELIELELTARDQNDNEIAANTNGDVPVTVGEIFNLEVSYRDLRGFSGTGAFRVATDLTFDPSSPITPALTETQRIFIDPAITEETGTVVFSLEGAPGTTVDLDIDDFITDDTSGNVSVAATAKEVEAVLQQLGYSADQVDARSEIVQVDVPNPDDPDGTDPDEPDTIRVDRLLIEIRYLGNDLVNEDLPGLMVDVNATNPISANTVEIDAFNSDGTVNGNAVPFNLILDSRTFGGEPFYNNRVFGTYSEATGFDEVGGLGKTEDVPTANNGEFDQPFDAFSIPVIVTEPVTGLVAELNPPDVGDGILLYGTDEGEEQVPTDMILLDEDSRVSITASEVLEGPQAKDGTLTTSEEVTVTADLADEEFVTIHSGGAASFAITTNGSRGNASLDGSILSYTPDPDEFGSDTVVYTATNSEGSSSGTITVTIDPVNDAPVAQDDTANTQEETPVVIDVLQNDETGADNEDDTLSVVEPTGGAANGSVEINSDDTVTYTPAPGFFGTDTFTYTVSDGTDTDEGTVTVTVEEAPDVISAGNGVLETTEDETDDPVRINLSELVTVIEGGNPSFSIATNGSRGTAMLIEEDGSTFLSYVPDADEFGSDTVVYTATNDEGSDSGTVTISITPSNDAPVANDDTAGTSEGTAVNIPVLDNDDTGAENEDDDLSVANVTDGANGTTTINADGTVRYTPDADFNGTDEFTYTISDGTDTSESATVTISVTAVNDPPVANPDSATTDEDIPVDIDVLDNDTTGGEDELDTLTVVDASAGANGSTTVNSDNTVTYTPDDDFFGSDTFTYTVSDGTNTSQGTVTVEINSVNDPPVAVDDTDSVVKNGSLTIDVLANDNTGAANEDDTLEVVSATSAANGSTTVNADGTITYTPVTDFLGTDTFTYTITDGSATAQGTVTVDVLDFEPSTLSGSVFFDHVENINDIISDGADPIRNGIQDNDESGMGGMPVRLVSDADANISGQRVEITTFTQVDGSYEFDDVVPGTYEIIYDIPDTVIYGRDVGDAPGGSPDDGVIELTIGEAGGVSRSGLNFTLLATRGSAIDHVDLLASTYLNGDGDGSRTGGLVSLNEDGTQNWFKSEGGFDGVLFAELTFNEKRDAALLTIVEEDGSIKTANLSEDQFVVSSDGTAAAFIGGRADLNFADSGTDLVKQEFENYRDTIDQILAEFSDIS